MSRTPADTDGPYYPFKKSPTRLFRTGVAAQLPFYVAGAAILWIEAGKGAGITSACLTALAFDLLVVLLRDLGVAGVRLEASSRELQLLGGLAVVVVGCLVAAIVTPGDGEEGLWIGMLCGIGANSAFVLYLLVRHQVGRSL